MTPITRAPRIAVVKTSTVNDAAPAGLNAGDTITYTYTVSNEGNTTLFDVGVTETAGDFTGNGTLPAPAFSSGGGDLDGDADAADLAVGAGTIVFEATYTIVQADIDQGGVNNRAVASGSDPVGTPVSDQSDDNSPAVGEDDPTTTPLTPTPGIGVVKTAAINDGGDGRVDAGDTITYTYTVSNQGNTT
ncbi:MAG: hypothetical protein AAGJ70_14645, partial [Pseudomonadota bacterium]